MAGWSPDDRQLVFTLINTVPDTSGTLGQILAINSDGSNQRVVASPGNTGWHFPCWSPDGLLFLDRDPQPPGRDPYLLHGNDSGGARDQRNTANHRPRHRHRHRHGHRHRHRHRVGPQARESSCRATGQAGGINADFRRPPPGGVGLMALPEYEQRKLDEIERSLENELSGGILRQVVIDILGSDSGAVQNQHVTADRRHLDCVEILAQYIVDGVIVRTDRRTDQHAIHFLRLKTLLSTSSVDIGGRPADLVPAPPPEAIMWPGFRVVVVAAAPSASAGPGRGPSELFRLSFGERDSSAVEVLRPSCYAIVY